MERLAHMLRKKILGLRVALLIMALLSAVPAGAYYNVRRFVPLKDLRSTGAWGEALIETYGSRVPGERVFSVDVYHLKPNSVYTVWLVNEFRPGERTGMYFLGIGTNSFRTDANGNGRYVTTTNEYDIEYWRFIEVDYHPDNDPRDTQGMVPVLQGDMIYGFHS